MGQQQGKPQSHYAENRAGNEYLRESTGSDPGPVVQEEDTKYMRRSADNTRKMQLKDQTMYPEETQRAVSDILTGSKGKPKSEKPKAAAPKGAELHSIETRKLHDGSFAHEHRYKDSKTGLSHHVTHEYSSADINDAADHMREHMGGGAPEPAGAQGEGEAGDQQDATGQAEAPQASGAPAPDAEEED